jgi:hypothetical protein
VLADCLVVFHRQADTHRQIATHGLDGGSALVMRGNHDRQRGVDLRRTFDEHGDEAVCTIGLRARCHDRIAVGEGLRWQLEFQQSHQVGFVQRDGAVHPWAMWRAARSQSARTGPVHRDWSSRL